MGEREAHADQVSRRLSREERRAQNRLWLGMFGPPIFFTLNLQISYAIVDWACLNHHRIILSIVPLVFLVSSIISGVIVRRELIRLRDRNSLESVEERSLFMARIATMISALFSLLIFAQFLATLFFSPCKT